ncbi:MAG: hypothetical protein QOI91_364 [Solirubrobacteraceae bacterium]|jgi:hypothetical protein|nr:hypothetical protein [Solirubrobacteraceae bacterium]
MADVAIWVVAAGFAAMGLYALATPASVPALFGVEVRTAEGRNEVRAVYGGFGLAMAALLGVAAAGHGGVREGILVTVGFALAGMAAGRVVGAVVDRRVGLWPVWTFFAIEVACAAVLLAIAWS